MSSRDMTVQVLDELGEPGVLVHGIAHKPGKPTIVALVERKARIRAARQSGLGDGRIRHTRSACDPGAHGPDGGSGHTGCSCAADEGHPVGDRT